ncbi:MAG TPA: hypothetical protein VLM92_14330, partial [Romboutsia sp.]|nr:hypothetical protein [Romboutsia sp.]
EDFSVLGLGETKQEALRNYREALSSKGNNIKIESDTSSEKIEGTVVRISPDVKSGNTFYYMTISANESIIFNATSKLSTELPLTVVGDKVKISYQKGEKGFVDIVEFDNLNLGEIKATNPQEQLKEDKKEQPKKTVENTNQ